MNFTILFYYFLFNLRNIVPNLYTIVWLYNENRQIVNLVMEIDKQSLIITYEYRFLN